MSWQDRPYSGDENSCGGGPPPGGGPGGMRSWFGGLPAAGRVVKWLLGINIAIFLLGQFTGRGDGFIYAWFEMQTEAVLGGQIWRLFTFTYLHDPDSLWHVGMNMLGLYFLGVPLERHWGGKRFFVFYTLGGAVAVFLYFVLTVVGWLDPRAILIGASGNVLAVLGVCAVLFPGFRLIFLFFPVPIRTAAVILVALYSFNLLSRGGNAGGDACHLAGLAFGIIWGYKGHLWTHAWQQKREAVRRGAWEAKRREQQGLEDDVDKILEKVHRDGINSLTRREKRKLETATKDQRDQDHRHQL